MLNEIAHLAAFLARHRPTRERPRHERIDGRSVQLAQSDDDLSWSFLLLGAAWSGPYPGFDEAVESARRAVARHRGCTCPEPFAEDDLACASCERSMLELQAKLDEAGLPDGIDWDEYSRRQG
jgi:hypothetical protein